jgi:hypothetical protein
MNLRIDSTRERIIKEEEERPEPRPSPDARIASYVAGGHDIAYSADMFGGASCYAPNAERAVAGRADVDRPLRLDGNTTQAERLANLPRLTQIDGDRRTALDRQTCGVQCIVAALYVQNPAGIRKIAGMELAKNGEKLAAWAPSLGMPESELRSTLTAIANGTATPRQIATLSQVLLLDLRSRIPIDNIGLSPCQIETLTKEIIVKDSGVPAPAMRLQLGGNHWTAEIDVASRADVEENAKADSIETFDPFPRRSGMSQTHLTLTPEAAAKLRAGPPTATHRVQRDGSLDDGKTCEK